MHTNLCVFGRNINGNRNVKYLGGLRETHFYTNQDVYNFMVCDVDDNALRLML